MLKNCIYFLKDGDKELKFDNERSLEQYLKNSYLSNLDLDITDIVYSLNGKVDFTKKYTDILYQHLKTSKARLEIRKKEGLANYKGEEDIIEYSDDYKSVLGHITERYMDTFKIDDFRKNRKSQILEQNPNINNEAVENMIQNEIDSWEYIRKTGKALDAITTQIFNKYNTGNVFNIEKFKKDYKSDYGTYDLEGVENLIPGFVEQLIELKKNIGTGATIFTQYVVESEKNATANAAPLRGKIDLLVVRDNAIDIYDLKVSSKFAGNLSSNTDWDRDKVETAKYQLAYYKQMVHSLGIPLNKISVNIIPVQLEGIKYLKNNSTVENINIERPIKLPIEEHIAKRAKDDIFTDMARFVNDSIIDKAVKNEVDKFFNTISFGEVFNTTNLEYHAEKMIKKRGNKYILEYFDSDRELITIEEDTREALYKPLKDYLEVNKSNFNSRRIPFIRNELARNLHTYNQGALERGILFERENEQTRLNLMKYFNVPGWRVLGNSDAEVDKLLELNTIILVNDQMATPQLDVIIFSNEDLKANVGDGNRTSLLHKFYTDNQLISDKMILPATIGNIELIKGMAILNNLKDYLGIYRISDIRVLNPNKGLAAISPISKLRHNYKLLTSNTGIINNIAGDRLFLSSYEIAKNVIDYVVNINSNSKINQNALIKFKQSIPSDLKASIDNVIQNRKNFNYDEPDTTGFGDESGGEKIFRLKEIGNLYEVLTDYETFKKGLKPDDMTFEAFLYRTIANAMTDESNLYLDFYNISPMTKFGVSFEESKRKAFLNGTMVNTLDTIPILKPIHDILQKTLNRVRNNYYYFYKQRSRQYHDKISSFLENATVNASMFRMSDFYDKSEKGKKEFLFKDPETDNTLNDTQRKYLTWYIETLNLWRYGEIDNKTGAPKELSVNQKNDLKLKGLWLQVPIARGSTYSRAVNGALVKAWRDNLTVDTLNQRKEVEMNFDYMQGKKDYNEMKKMYNTFNLHQEQRADMLARYDDPHTQFETHLEQILDMFILSKISQIEYDRVLPGIHAAVASLQFTSYMSNVDTKDTVDFINNYLRSAVFNESLITESNQMGYKALTALKKVATKMILGANPILAGKETLYGIYQNYTRAIANSVFDKNRVGLKDMTKAYGIVWNDVLHQVHTQTLLENFNHIYGISNFDRNSMVEQMNYFKADSPFRMDDRLFWPSKAPDFLNRMTLLVGYMVKNGSYDAHSLNKYGELEYDWRKDKRFELYANNDKSNLKEYNFQKALYFKMLQEMIEVEKLSIRDKNTGEIRLLTMEDDLPRAFINLETKAIKQESDTAFGYMDHDTKSLLFKQAIGSLLFQFKTFITGRKNQYMLTPDTYDQGNLEHLKDAEGNELYWTVQQNQDGSVERIMTTEITDDPVIDWKGSMMEGIFWSTLDLISFWKGKEHMKEAWSDPVKLRNLLIGLEELFIFFLIVLSLSAMWGGITNYKSNIAREEDFFTRNALTILWKSGEDISVFDLINNGISFEYPAWTWGGRFADSIGEWLTGDRTFLSAVARNTGVFAMFRKEINDRNRDIMTEKRKAQ